MDVDKYRIREIPTRHCLRNGINVLSSTQSGMNHTKQHQCAGSNKLETRRKIVQQKRSSKATKVPPQDIPYRIGSNKEVKKKKKKKNKKYEGEFFVNETVNAFLVLNRADVPDA